MLRLPARPDHASHQQDDYGRPKIVGADCEIDPEQARWVKWIFEQHASGSSPRWIATELNRLGEARRLGFKRLFTATDSATGLFERRGWRAFDRAPTLRGTVTVYALDLAEEQPS